MSLRQDGSEWASAMAAPLASASPQALALTDSARRGGEVEGEAAASARPASVGALLASLADAGSSRGGTADAALIASEETAVVVALVVSAARAALMLHAAAMR